MSVDVAASSSALRQNRPLMRGRRLATGLAAATALAAAATGAALAYYVPPADGPEVSNPCGDERATELACPDLKMAKPSGLYLTGNKLHATSNLRSRGKGPMEIRGKRTGPRTMRVNQVIYKLGRGKLQLPTNGHLVLYYVPGQGPYWKFHHAASFELRTVGSDGDPDELVRVGPKINYCLRDLTHTDPGKGSPAHPVYPGCSQNPREKYRTLGTSPGWSDIYPASYDKNWISVGGLHGCFWFIQRADPENYLYESNEINNAGMRKIHLPPKGGRVHGC
ncbi:MAG: hypothetical protein JWM24_118 [Solirubrobacterales bacterium]|nr:hypothetical protein [Solirubrobacterales bacterium]